MYKAIIHLREPAVAGTRGQIALMLEGIDGVDQVELEPAESLITMRFDGEQAGLADIVRTIEDCGPIVCGVAQRPVG